MKWAWILLLLLVCSASALTVAETGFSGGLMVHLGCDDADLLAEFARHPAALVQGLASEWGTVKTLREAGVVADRQRGPTLPFTDNLVNVLVVDDPGEVSREEMLRVLVPQGMLVLPDGEKVVKPRPAEMDEWTHFLHSPNNNAVARDTLVGPPAHLQWMAPPKFSRAHEQSASFSVTVTAGGRMFYVLDEAPTVDIRLPSRWVLVARDAFNGIALWKRPMGKWVNQFRRFRSGPANLPFRLVATADEIYVTLDFEGPVHALDARTGETLRVYEGSERTKQIIYERGVLTFLIDHQVGKIEEMDKARAKGTFIPHQCEVRKVQAATGDVYWKKAVDELIFPCMAYDNGRLVAQTTSRVFSLDFESGRQRWTKDFEVKLPISAGKIRTGEMQWEAPTLVLDKGVVLAADFKKTQAFSVESGEVLWEGPSKNGYNAPADVFVIGDTVWMAGKGGRQAMDLKTGKVQKSLAEHKGYMHARCYRNKATERFFMLGDMGVQMIDLESGTVYDNDWIRGVCQYGIMPANGLLYVPPDSCACNMKSKLSGIYALASVRAATFAMRSDEAALEKGAAADFALADSASKDGWPTYRGNAARNGRVASAVPADLKPAWTAKVGGRLSGVVAADGQAYVAAIDTHTVHAFDMATGAARWKFTTGSRVDSPPTLHRGAVYFGSADGYVYALRASDGELMWRFQAAPEDRRVMINGQLESAWPVHGAVLVHADTLVVAAGRSSYLDSGIFLYRLDPASGNTISKTSIFSPDPKTGRQRTGEGRDVRGVLNDVLLADGEDVFMRHAKLDFASGDETGKAVHLFTPLGFLDDSWWHRAYWVMHDEFLSHWSGWWKVGNSVPSGRIMCYDKDSIFGYGRSAYPGGNTGQWRGGEKYQLYACDRKAPQPVAAAPKPPPESKSKSKRKGRPKKPALPKVTYRWTQGVPLLATSMAVAGEHIFLAGPPDVAKPQGTSGEQLLHLTNAEAAADAWEGKGPGVLSVHKVGDGSQVAESAIPAPPVFDGMAAAGGSLFLALKNGELICLKQP
jgi:outer membrane protein assembly factor BamB